MRLGAQDKADDINLPQAGVLFGSPNSGLWPAADFTEGSTVPAARLRYEYGGTSLASATSQQFTPETAQKTPYPSRLPL